MPVTPGRARA